MDKKDHSNVQNMKLKADCCIPDTKVYMNDLICLPLTLWQLDIYRGWANNKKFYVGLYFRNAPCECINFSF